MVIINNQLYLSVKELCTSYGFSQAQLDKKCSEFRSGDSKSYNNIKAVDHAFGSAELTCISFDSIPEATRIEKGMPVREALLAASRQSQILALTGLDQDAYTFFLQSPDIKATKSHSREQIAKGKAEQVHLLAAIAKVKTKECALRGFSSKDEFYSACITSLNTLAESRSWHAWKCTTLAGFRKRLKPFLQTSKGKASSQDCWSSLISKKVGNDNAQKLDLDQQSLLVQLYSNSSAKPNTEQVWAIYTRKAKEMIAAGLWTDKSLVTDSTVRQFLDKPSVKQLWYEARHGYQQYRNTFEPITKRERPTFANALWVIDGTPSHRYFQHGEKGRYFRFNIFPVLDAHSWCVVGFWLSETENTDAVLGALRSACMVTSTLPHQVLYDNSSAIQSFRAQEAIDKISIVAFAATAGNARAKIIEPFFHLFNQDVQRFRPGFTHNPFALTLNNRPNREALAKLVKSQELPLAEAALNQAVEDLTIWNNTPRKFLAGMSPLGAYRKSVAATESRQRKFTKAIDIEAFYALPGEHKKVRTIEDGKPKLVSTFQPQLYPFTNRGIDITIKGRVVTYDIADERFRANFIGQHFSVKYEPNHERWSNGEQPDELLLYLNNSPMMWKDEHLVAKPVERFHMAVADYTPGERARLTESQQMKKRQRSLVQSDFEEILRHTKANGTYTEVITENAFDKNTLTEANSQLLNQIIQGEDFNLTTFKSDGPKDDTEDGPEYDRLSGFDEDEPIQ